MPTLPRLILTLLLIALPSTMLAGDFRFDASAGPVFSELEKKGQREAGAGVVPMVIEAFHNGADTVRILAGDYRFDKERWGRDGVIYALEFAGLQRDEAHPFTIDATGATFWFDLPDDQAPTCHFCVGFKDCRNIVFKGATIDRATRGHVEGRITQFDFPGNRIELQVSPGITVPATFNGKLEQRVIPFKADGTFCAPLYALQAGGLHLKYAGISPASADGRCWVTMGDTKLLDTIKSGGLLRIGDGLSCVYTVTAALEIIRSSRMVMDGIRVFAAKAWGLERDGEGAHAWRNCYFGPRPGTSQWQGGEGFMFNATRHGTTLDRVTICHTTDDTANFHGYWSPVASVERNQVLLGENAETRRALPHDLRLGDSVIFLARDSGEELGRGKVTAIEGNRVTLDRPAAPFAHALVEWPDHACAGWLIQNCDWHDNYQRLLIQSGPGTVRNCRFTRFGSALELNSVLPYVEGGVPHDIRIEDNTFTDVNSQPGGAAISVYSHACQRDKMPLLRNITITGNTFDHPNEPVIALEGVDGVRIEGNRFPGSAHPVQLKRCANAVVQAPEVSLLSGYIGSHAQAYRVQTIADEAAYALSGQPDYVAVTEVYPDVPEAIQYRYSAQFEGLGSYARCQTSKGFGPTTYFIKTDNRPVGNVKVLTDGTSSRHPVSIAAVRALSKSELTALLDADDFRIMGLVPTGLGPAERDRLARQLSGQGSRPEYHISKGFSAEIFYAAWDAAGVKNDLLAWRGLARKYNLPVMLGLVSWWAGTPLGVADGLGGTFGDIKYQQICYAPDLELPENPALRGLLRVRYNRHYLQTVPNQWSNTPWLTMNSDVLNRYRYRRLEEVVGLLREVSAGNASWLHSAFLENEPRYWDQQCDTKGRNLWADFNPCTVEAARNAGVDLNPADGLVPAELIWLHQNVGRYNQETVDCVATALSLQKPALDLQLYTHALVYPDFVFPGKPLNHTSAEWAYATGARTGIEGVLNMPSDYGRVREWGRWANVNREEGGWSTDLSLWDLRVAYMMGADLYNSYNWHPHANRLAYVDEFLQEFPVVRLPPTKAECPAANQIRIATPMKLQAFSRVELPVLVRKAFKGQLTLNVADAVYNETEPPAIRGDFCPSMPVTVDLAPGPHIVAFDFPTPAESRYNRRALLTLSCEPDTGVAGAGAIVLTADSAAGLMLAVDLQIQRALSLWVIKGAIVSTLQIKSSRR